jgi:hypothetical protein
MNNNTTPPETPKVETPPSLVQLVESPEHTSHVPVENEEYKFPPSNELSPANISILKNIILPIFIVAVTALLTLAFTAKDKSKIKQIYFSRGVVTAIESTQKMAAEGNFKPSAEQFIHCIYTNYQVRWSEEAPMFEQGIVRGGSVK